MEQCFFLQRGELVAVHGTATNVTVAGGGAWITQHGDFEDYFVQDGTWASKSDGLILVHAIRECRVLLVGPAAAKARLRRRGAPETCALERWFAFARA